MTREEHRYLRDIRAQYVDWVDIVARKMIYDRPKDFTLDELVEKREAYHLMIEVFQDAMIDKYRLEPLYTNSPFLPKGEKGPSKK